MARVKVRLADTLARVVFIETAATIGATIGTDLLLPDGSLATRESLADFLGVGADEGQTATHHRLLQGLNLGDDHPQYVRKDTLTTRGDLYVRGASTVGRKALGTIGQLLRSDGTDPQWVNLSPVITLGTDLSGNATLTNLASATLNATIVNNAVTDAKLRDSASGTVIGRAAVGVGDPSDLTLTQVLDMVGSAAQGDILYRGAASWTRLAAGSNGNVLTTHGAAADPTWEAASGGSGGLVYVNTSVPAGNTVANTVTETAFDSSYTIPADQLQAGSVIRLKLFGVFSTDAVAPTLRIRVQLDGADILDTGAVTLTAGLTNQGWTLDSTLVCFTDGATGTLDAQALAEFATGAAAGQLVNLENNATATIDTTGTLPLTVSVEWGTADADNTITLRDMTVDLLDAVTPTAAAPAAATYLTEDDETADLPNSRQLLAGTNITFDDSVAGERTVSAAASGGGNVTPDTHPSSPDAMDDEFEAGSLDAIWSWRNQGTSTVAFSHGAIVLSPQLVVGLNNRCLEQPLPGGNWKFRGKLSGVWPTPGSYGGLHLTGNVSGKQVMFFFQNSLFRVGNANSVTSYNGDVATAYTTALDGGFEDWIYFEIEYNGTNLIFRFSNSGLTGTFRQIYTTTPGAFLGAVPTHIGFHASPNSTTVASVLALDWFRRIS